MSDRDLQILRLIDEGTAAKTGTAFFRELVQRLSHALESRYAFVSRFSDDYERVHLLAFWTGEGLQEDVSYALKGTPCEQVLAGEIVAHDRGVADLFPLDHDVLAEMRAEAYLAIPLRNPAGRVLGHLAVIATESKNWRERDFGILRIFAARATAEIERQNAERELVEANAELARRANLEGLITSISTRFVTLEAGDIDAAIETSLGEVASFARSERARVFRRSDDGEQACVTHEWVAAGIERTRDQIGAVQREDAPAVFDHFIRNQVLLVPKREELPEQFAPLKDLMRRQGVLSTVIVPMVYGNRPVGALAFHSLHHEQDWSEQDVRLLRLLGEIVAGAMFRKDQEQALRHRLELERLIAGISTRFVSGDTSRIDAEIDYALRVIGCFIGSERGVLYRFSEDGSIAALTNEWLAQGCASVREFAPELRRSYMPEVFEHFVQQRTINASAPDELPAGFEKLNQLQGGTVRSRIAVPIVYAKRALGMLGFHSDTAERHWPAEDVRLMGLLGEIVAGAFARRDAETALERARDAAESASRAKSEFLANMSHELRTPLNGILGYAQLLRRDSTLGQEQAERVAAIERCGEHLLTLISEVLDLAKIEAGKLELELARFDLDGFLRDLADIGRVRTMQGGLAFSFETSGRLPVSVVADQRKLRQVLLNLLGNAAKFTRQGTVRFRVHGEEIVRGTSQLRFEVEDTGVGIPAQELERIFDPFQQVRHAGDHVEGTGLGLAICRKLVQLMGGRLDVASTPGSGSRFTIEVDVEDAHGALQVARDAAPSVIGYAGRRRRILVVDDKADNRSILGSFLRSLGFEVDEAVDGRMAIELAERTRPDAVFMDLVMPLMDGFEAIRRLRQDPALEGLKIIALSASAYDSTRAQSVSAGCDAFLSKPLRLDQVVEQLGRELELEWKHERRNGHGERQGVARANSAAVHDLPPALARELYELAMQGDVRQLMRRLAEIRGRDGSLSEAVVALEYLGRDYDMRGLRAVLKPLTEHGA